MKEAMLSYEGMGGLMTVIAVSGSVVVLLALGRQKLLENCTHSLQSSEDEDACRLEDDTGPVSWIRFPPLSVIIKQVKEEKEQRPTQAGSNWGRILVQKNTNFNSEDLQSTKVSKSSMATAEENCSGCNASVRKKVRFSEDVVEPCGNSKEYRKRQSLAIRERLTLQENCSSWNNHHRYHPQQEVQQRHCKDDGVTNPNTNNYPYSQNEEQQTSHRDQAKPSLPANRMVLYNSIIQSRSRRSLAQYY